MRQQRIQQRRRRGGQQFHNDGDSNPLDVGHRGRRFFAARATVPKYARPATLLNLHRVLPEIPDYAGKCQLATESRFPEARMRSRVSKGAAQGTVLSDPLRMGER